MGTKKMGTDLFFFECNAQGFAELKSNGLYNTHNVSDLYKRTSKDIHK